MRIAFASYVGQPQGSRDDALALTALASDAETLTVPWDRPGFDWRAVDAVVLRSCWNYHLELPRFLAWISNLEALAVPVLNSPDLVRWNANKGYLRQLEAQGLEVVPTHWIEPGQGVDLAGTLDETGWPRTVIKPTVGASSHQTHVVEPKTAIAVASRLPQNGDHGGFLVQPFLDEIVEEGEWSLMFFGGRFSHAVVKRPRSGDFRVQSEFDGTAERREPDRDLVRQAQDVLECLSETPLYARVDGVDRSGSFVLMELELIEPQLFFGLADGAASRFAYRLREALAAPTRRRGEAGP